MRNFLDQIRTELTLTSDRLPLLTYVIASCVLLTPMALLGNGLADVVISTAAALFLIRSAVQRDVAWAREPWIAVAIVLWLYLVARGFLSIDPESSGVKALSWIRFIVFGSAVHFVLSQSTGMRKALLYSIVAMASFGAADALLQFAVGTDLFGRPKIGQRLTGPLKNQAIGMLISIVGLPAIFYLFRNIMLAYQAGRFHWQSAAVLLLMFSAVVLSGERFALLMTIVLVGVVTLVLSRSFVKASAGFVLFAAFVASMVMLTSPQLVERQLSTLKEVSAPTQSIYTRAMLAGIEVAKDHPVFGVGIKNFQKHCPDSAPVEVVGDACKLIHPHQVWLHIASETGLVGVAGFLTLFFLALSPAVQQWRSWADEPLLAGATIAVLVRLLPITPSGNFFSNWRESFFWFLLGTAAAMGRVVAAEKAKGAAPSVVVSS